MRTARLLAILLSIAVCGFAQAERCRIEGRAVSLAGAPLRKVQVVLEPFGVMRAPSVARTTTSTDADGHFAFDGLEPGSYQLSATRNGYLDQGYGASGPMNLGPPFKLAAGQKMGDVVLKLTPQSFIYGKILDEDGEPMVNASVRILRVPPSNTKQPPVSVKDLTSQDDGSFIAGGLVPGRYYVAAEGPPVSDQHAREVYVTTLFPSALDAAAASPLELLPGAELRGIDVRLRKSRVFHIAGRLLNSVTGAPAAKSYLKLKPADEAAPDRGVALGNGGEFMFTDLLPGRYSIETGSDVQVASMEPSGNVMKLGGGPVGRYLLQITDHDIEDLTLSFGSGVELTGMVHGAPGATVLLTRSDTPIVSEVENDGSFRMQRLVPDVYNFDVKGLPSGAYVKAVRFREKDVTRGNIDLSSGEGGPLDVVVSPDAAEINGVVRTEAGEAAAGSWVQLWMPGEERARSLQADENGTFHVTGVPPGQYRMLAWRELDQEQSDDPSLRARFETQATTLTLGEKARETVELKSISRK